jgi:hypothetical protein
MEIAKPYLSCPVHAASQLTTAAHAIETARRLNHVVTVEVCFTQQHGIVLDIDATPAPPNADPSAPQKAGKFTLENVAPAGRG